MAANTGIIDGGDLLLYVEIATVWTLIGEATSHQLSRKSEVRVRRTKTTGKYPARKVIGLDAEVTTDCLATYDGYGYYDLCALQEAKTPVKLKLAGKATAGDGVAEQAGDKYQEATFVIDSIDLNAKEGDDAGFTAKFSIEGGTSTNGLEIKTKT